MGLSQLVHTSLTFEISSGCSRSIMPPGVICAPREPRTGRGRSCFFDEVAALDDQTALGRTRLEHATALAAAARPCP